YCIKNNVVSNSHDGNIPTLDIAQRNVNARHKDVVVALLPAWWSVLGGRRGGNFFREWDGLGHGGGGESAMTAAVCPDLCDLSKAGREMREDRIRDGGKVQ
ncbi:creatininase family protein, partial [Morganella morganii]|uniref:creatininase family protein n=1 Tax=Morganella morganii TaxID=582 RepID=UPI0015F47CC2